MAFDQILLGSMLIGLALGASATALSIFEARSVPGMSYRIPPLAMYFCGLSFAPGGIVFGITLWLFYFSRERFE